MDNLEDQLNQLLTQSDRVSAELKREIYLVERADAAIRYLRAAREKTAHEVAGLLAQRPREPRDPSSLGSSLGDVTSRLDNQAHKPDAEHQAFGPYDPQWPNGNKRPRFSEG